MIVQNMPRTLLHWGFWIIILVLLYVHMAQVESKEKYWNLMIYYSVFIIIMTMIFMVCQLPIFKSSTESYADSLSLWKRYLLKQSFGKVEYNHKNDLIRHGNLEKFVPYLIFFFFSLYINNEIKEWAKHDVKLLKIEQEIKI